MYLNQYVVHILYTLSYLIYYLFPFTFRICTFIHFIRLEMQFVSLIDKNKTNQKVAIFIFEINYCICLVILVWLKYYQR